MSLDTAEDPICHGPDFERYRDQVYKEMSENYQRIDTAVSLHESNIVPQKSDLASRSEADIRTKFTKEDPQGRIITEITSGLGDFLTNWPNSQREICILAPLHGLIATTSRDLSIENQVALVETTKSYGVKPLILDINNNLPLNAETVSSMTAQDALNRMELTRNNILFESRHGLDITHFCTYTTADMFRGFEITDEKISGEFKALPPEARIDKDRATHENILELMKKHNVPVVLITSNSEVIGYTTFNYVMESNPHMSLNQNGSLAIASAIGVRDLQEVTERYQALREAGNDIFIIDVAHAHSKKVLDTLAHLREIDPEGFIIAGNIATALAAEDLIRGGADGVKTGIGGGSTCLTSIATGAGSTSLRSLMEVGIAIEYLKNVKGIIPQTTVHIFDGGLGNTGNQVKARIFADASMRGGSASLLEADTRREINPKTGRVESVYCGNGSLARRILTKHGRHNLVGSEKIVHQLSEATNGFNPYSIFEKVDEGGIIRKPIRGEAAAWMLRMRTAIGGALGYFGARNWQEFREIVRSNKALQIQSNGGVTERGTRSYHNG